MSKKPHRPLQDPNDQPTRTLPTEAEIADALHADACPEDPDDGESCTCADYLREARIVLALFGQQRCAPSEDGLADVLRDILVRVFEQDKDIVAQDAARIVLDLFADQPTVEQIKAEALLEESHYLRERISDATAARNRFDPDSQQWAEFDQGIRRMAEEANRLSLRANRIESEG